MIHKACPIVLHPNGAPLRLLAFEHPNAGPQIVKGTVETDENPMRAAVRELWEEAGLDALSAVSLGQSADIVQGQTWHFALCRIRPLVRENWQHFCPDDGGHMFRFFWQDLYRETAGYDPIFVRAFEWVTHKLGAP